jgi:hypothetical protein
MQIAAVKLIGNLAMAGSGSGDVGVEQNNDAARRAPHF